MEPTDQDAGDAVVEMALAEELGAETPPDLWPRLQATGDVTAPVRHWLAAAMIVLALSIVGVIALLDDDEQRAATEPPEQGGNVAIDARGPASLAALQATLQKPGAVRDGQVQARQLWSEELGTWIPLTVLAVEGLFQPATHPDLDEQQLAAVTRSLLAATQVAGATHDIVWQHTLELTLTEGSCRLLISEPKNGPATVAFASPRGAIPVAAPGLPLAELQPVFTDCIAATIAARGIVIGPQGFDAVPDTSTRLRLHRVPATSAPRLLTYRKLRQLDITAAPEWHASSALQQVASLPLRSLIARGQQLDSASIAAIATMTSLEELHCIGTDGTDFWAAMQAQRHTPVAPALDDPALQALANLPELSELTLSGGVFGDAGFGTLARITKLRQLHLMDCTNITGVALQAFAGHGLSKLDLRGCSSLRLEFLADLPQLRSLFLGSSESAIDLHALPDLPALGYLLLDGRVSAPQLTTLSRFANLRKLGLRPVPALRDADLASLHGLTQITSLRIFDHDGLSANSLATLQAALPACRISSELW